MRWIIKRKPKIYIYISYNCSKNAEAQGTENTPHEATDQYIIRPINPFAVEDVAPERITVVNASISIQISYIIALKFDFRSIVNGTLLKFKSDTIIYDPILTHQTNEPLWNIIGFCDEARQFDIWKSKFQVVSVAGKQSVGKVNWVTYAVRIYPRWWEVYRVSVSRCILLERVAVHGSLAKVWLVHIQGARGKEEP